MPFSPPLFLHSWHALTLPGMCFRTLCLPVCKRAPPAKPNSRSLVACCSQEGAEFTSYIGEAVAGGPVPSVRVCAVCALG